ncbi:unnamed protein product [Symbiodinium sp. CCMP2592]|nr:unnamed protein product [Symbiodinium sp. CCMP2592]
MERHGPQTGARYEESAGMKPASWWTEWWEVLGMPIRTRICPSLIQTNTTAQSCHVRNWPSLPFTSLWPEPTAQGMSSTYVSYPALKGLGSAEETLDAVAKVFHECTEASGRPPNGLAFDGGSNKARILQTLLLGLLEPEKMQSLPFFSQCSVKTIPKLPCWGFGYLTYKDEILVAMNGAWHWQKRYSLAHLSGCRKIRHGAVFVDLSCELSCGLPHSAYLASDVQSDLAACQRLSPPYTGKTWCSPAVNVHSLIGALVCSCTTGSVGFSQEDICLNAAAGYYLLLMHRSEAGRQWLKSVYRGQPSLKDYLHACRSLSARQARQLDGQSVERLQDRASSFPRSPMPEDVVTKLCRKAFAAALQTQSFISDGRSTTEIYDTLLKFCGAEGESFFGTAIGESAFDIMDITPETSEWLPVEETEHKSQQQVEAMQLLHTVKDRAKVLEEIQLLEASDASDAHQPACQPAEENVGAQPACQPAEQNEDAQPACQPAEENVDAQPACQRAEQNEDAPQDPELVVELAPESGKEFNLDHETGQGQAAVLKRLLHMAPFIRSFTRHARLQEAVLSAATLNECKGPLNEWNRREHELAVARRAINASQARLSRAQAWHMALQKMSKEVQAVNKQVHKNDPGIHAPDVYFPAGDRVQLIAFLLEDRVAVGLVLSAFRGSLVKRPNGKGAADVIVKTARPFPDELPSVSTKLVHVAECIYDEKHSEYCTSCAARCLLVDPVNCIYGQLTVSASKPSQTRMHFRLSPASMESLRLLKLRGRLPVQPLPEVAEGEDDAAAEPEEPDAPSQVYHDRSFMRASMPVQARKFMSDLESLYRRKGWPFVESGMVYLSQTKSESWSVLLDRIPGFFEQEFQKHQGYRFSRAVHAYLQTLIPERDRHKREVDPDVSPGTCKRSSSTNYERPVYRSRSWRSFSIFTTALDTGVTSVAWLQEDATVFADDLLMQWIFHGVQDLEHMLGTIAHCFRILAQLGLQVQHRKTQLIVAYKGRQAKQWWRAHTASTSEGRFLLIPQPGHKALRLPIVTQLTYLGIVLSYTDATTATVEHRLQVAEAQRARLLKALIVQADYLSRLQSDHTVIFTFRTGSGPQLMVPLLQESQVKAQELGWITSDMEYNFLDWDFEEKKLVPRQAETLTQDQILADARRLKTLLKHPDLILKFSGGRNTKPDSTSETATFVLSCPCSYPRQQRRWRSSGNGMPTQRSCSSLSGSNRPAQSGRR